MRRKKRKQHRLKLPNRLAYLLIAMVLMSGIGLIVRQVEPGVLKNIGIPGTYLPFLVLVGLVGFFGMLGVGIPWWRSLWWSMVTTIFLLLRIFDLGNLVNAALLLLLGLVFEYYVRLSSKVDVDSES